MSKLKQMSLVLSALFFAACTSQSMPSFSRLIELENELFVSVEHVYWESLIMDHADPAFGGWTVIVVRGEAEKTMDELKRYSCTNDAGGKPPLILTMDAYAERLQKESRPKPGPQPGNYLTIEQRIAEMRANLKEHPALIYRYCRKYPPTPSIKR